MSTHQDSDSLKIGWASVDITPQQRVMIAGQFYMRISEGVHDPLSATAMAMESTRPNGESVRVVMVSCDVVTIPRTLRATVREQACAQVPELEPTDIVLNATHTHAGPEIRGTREAATAANVPAELGDIDIPEVMSPDACSDFITERVVDAIMRAWNDRVPSGIGYGLGHATVGYNRRICFTNGETKMYGGVDKAEFSHIEAGVDPAINVLCTWDRDKKLTGVVVNIACPSQVAGHLYELSADYWHETRLALRKQLGEDIGILPQCSAAGDIVPGASWRTVPEWRTQERMYEYEGVTQREDIARRITQAVVPIVEGIGREIDWNPTMAHRAETLALPLRKLTEQDVAEAEAAAEPHREKYDQLRQELKANPKLREENPRWYKPITLEYRRMLWNQRVRDRYEQQQRDPDQPSEAHVIRLGDVAFATNEFEYYLDYGLGIKGRSEAVQTFLVQLAGSGTYLPTERAAAGKSYGAVPASTPVGPEGGRQLATWTVSTINEMFGAQTADSTTTTGTLAS